MTPIRYRIFISSPGDVGRERQAAAKVLKRVEGWFAGRIKLEGYFWEHEPMRTNRGDFQQQIEEPANFDLVVCILWSRLGSRLHPGLHSRQDGTHYGSGTEYEFESAAMAFQKVGKPDLLVYRRTETPLFPPEPEDDLRRRMEQWSALKGFCERWFKDSEAGGFRAAFNQYENLADFETRLEQHLKRMVEARLLSAGAPTASAVSRERWWQGSPYRGLQAFDFEHEPIFQGRTRARDEVLGALRARWLEEKCPFVLIFGASGSGKSSLMRAGVLPWLVRPGVIEDVGLWRWLVLKPSAGEGDLLAILAAGLIGNTALPELCADGTSLDAVTGMLRDEPKSVVGLIKGALSQAALQAQATEDLTKPPMARLAVGIDQLEEIFTLQERFSPANRAAFFRAIAALARSGLVWVIATLRSDFYNRCEEIEELIELKQGRGQYHLLPPSAVEFSQMIRYPAEAVGVAFEDHAQLGKLEDRIRDEALAQPGALPLLEYALDLLYQAGAPDGVLTHAEFEAIGGVSGALRNKADETFASLPPDAQAALDGVLRGMVTLGEGDEEVPTRRTAFFDELTGTSQKNAEAKAGAQALLDAFVAQRLFLMDRDAQGLRTVTVAHEALLRTWPRITDWVAANREFLRVRGRIGRALAAWEEQHRHDDYLLPPGRPLSEAQELLDEHGDVLGADETAFVTASRARQSRQQARAARVRRIVMAGLSLLALVASFAGWQAMKEAKRAAKSETAALDATQEAQKAGVTARVSAADLHVENASRSIEAGRWGDALIHLAAAWQNDPSNSEVNLLLPISLRQLEGDGRFFQAHAGKVSALEVSPDGVWLASSSEHGEVRLWNAANESVAHDFHDHIEEVTTLIFHPPTGGPLRLATAGLDYRVNIYDVATGKRLGQFTPHVDKIHGAAFHPSGDSLLTWSEDATLAVLPITGQAPPFIIKTLTEGPARFACWMKNGTQVLVVHASGAVTLWDAATGRNVRSTASADVADEVNCAALDPTQQWLALGLIRGGVRIVEVATEKTVHVLRGEQSATTNLHFHLQQEPLIDEPAGVLYLHITYANGHLERWRPHLARQDSDFHYTRLPSHSGNGLTASALTADGALHAVTDAAGEVRFYHSATGRILNHAKAHRDGCFSLALNPSGSSFWTGGAHGEIRKWTLSGLRVRAHTAGISASAVDAGERHILTGGHDGMVRLWDSATGQFAREFRHATDGTTVHSVAFNAAGNRCLSAGGNEVRVWDLRQPETPPKIIAVEAPLWISDAKFTAQDTQVVFAVRTFQERPGQNPLADSDGDGWRIHAIENGKEVVREKDGMNQLEEVIPSPDGNILLSRGSKLAKTASAGHGLRWAEFHQATAVTFDDAKSFLVGFLDGRIRRLSLPDDPQWESQSFGSRVSTVAWNPTTGTALAGDAAGHLRVFDAANGSLKLDIQTGFPGVATALAPAGSDFLIASGRNGETSFWNRRSGRRLITWARHTHPLEATHFLPQTKRHVSTSADGDFWILNTGWDPGDLPAKTSARISAVIHGPEDIPRSYGDTPVITSALGKLASQVGTSAGAAGDEVRIAFSEGRWEDAWIALSRFPAGTLTTGNRWVKEYLGQRRAGLLRRLPPHPSPVRTLIPGSKHFHAIDYDNTLHSRTVGDFASAATFVSGRSTIFNAALSPDGTHLVLRGMLPEFIVVDVASGRRLATLTGFHYSALGGTFSSGGDYFYGSSYDRRIIKWSMPDGKKTREFSLPSDSTGIQLEVPQIAGEPHLLANTANQALLIRIADGGVRAFPPQKSEAAATERYVKWTLLNNDASRLFVGSTLGIEVFDRVSGERLQSFSLDGKDANRLAWTEGGDSIVAGTSDGWLYLVSSATGDIKARVWLPKGGEVVQIQTLPGGSTLIAKSNESGVSLWSLPRLKKLADLRFDGPAPGQIATWCSAAVPADGSTILTASMDGAVYVWETKALENRPPAEPAISYQPGFIPGQATNRIALWNHHGKAAQVLDATTGKLVFETALSSEPPIQGIHLWPDGTRMIVERRSGGKNGERRSSIHTLAPAKDGETPQPIAIDESIQRLEAVPGSSDVLLLEGSANQVLHRLDPKGQIVWSWKVAGHSRVIEIVITGSGPARACVADASGLVTALDLQTGDPLWKIENTGKGSPVIAATWREPVGQWIAVTRDGTLHVWNRSDSKLEKSVHGIGSRPRKVAFSDNGDHALIHGEDDAVELWDLKTFTRLNKLPPNPKLRTTALAADGSYFLTGSADGKLGLWLPDGRAPVLEPALLPAPVDSIRFLAGGLMFLTSTDGHATTWKPPVSGSQILPSFSER